VKSLLPVKTTTSSVRARGLANLLDGAVAFNASRVESRDERRFKGETAAHRNKPQEASSRKIHHSKGLLRKGSVPRKGIRIRGYEGDLQSSAGRNLREPPRPRPYEDTSK